MRIRNATVNIRNATIRVRQNTPPPPPVEFVGASQASFPVDHSTVTFGVSDVTIPVPVGVAVGDEMFAVVLTARPPMTVVTPTGWTQVRHNNFNWDIWMYQKTADSADAAGGKDYTWSHVLPPPNSTSNFSGTMIAFRNASSTIEDLTHHSDNFPPTTWQLPAVTSTVDGSAYCALIGGAGDYSFGPVIELTPTAPLLEGAEHSMTGAVKQGPTNAGCYYEENIGIETISGRIVTHDSTNMSLRQMYAFIVNPL